MAKCKALTGSAVKGLRPRSNIPAVCTSKIRPLFVVDLIQSVVAVIKRICSRTLCFLAELRSSAGVVYSFRVGLSRRVTFVSPMCTSSQSYNGPFNFLFCALCDRHL